MKAADPDGGTYSLRRRWWPWRWKQRISARPWDVTDLGALDFADGIAGFVFSIVALVVLAVAMPVVFLLLITGVEWLVLFVLLPIALLGRLILGKHWTIEVRHQDQLWEIDGGTWRESSAKLQQITVQIQHGHAPELGEPTTV